MLAPDPAGDLTRKKLGMIWESAVVEQMISMLDGSAVYRASLDSLPVTAFPDLVNSKISYDATTKMLRFTGPMTLDEQTTLLNLDLSADAGYLAAINNPFQQPRNFLKNTKAGFLKDPVDAQAQLLDTASLKTEEKFEYVLKELLPYLRETLSRSLVKQTLSDALKLDSAITELLLETLLKSPTDTSQLTMKDFLALFDSGISAAYFSDSQLATPLLTRTDTTIAFDGKETTPETTIPPNTGSVRWTGMLLSPNNGDFTFYINASGGVQLWVGDNSQLIQLQLDPETNELSSQPITLKAGQLYDLRLELTQLDSPAIVELRWSSPSTPKDIIPQSNLYPSSTYDAFISSFSLLHKAALLVNTFKMTDKEVAYLSAHGGDFAGVDPTNSADMAPFDLNTLPLEPSEFKPALVSQWERLFDLITLKNSLPQGEVGLLDVFASTSASESRDRLVALTGWEVAELDHLIGPGGFNLAGDYFKNEIALIRLKAAFDLVVQRSGFDG